MIYTEVETHSASLRERWQVLTLLWRCGSHASDASSRRWMRRRAIRLYVLSRRAYVSTYLVNRP